MTEQAIGWGSPTMDISIGHRKMPAGISWSIHHDQNRSSVITFNTGEQFTLTNQEVDAYNAEGVYAAGAVAQSVWRRTIGIDRWSGYKTMWSAMAGKDTE